MTKSGDEEFPIDEAFRRFADPKLLQRLDELEPHANSSTKKTERLHLEYQRLFQQIDNAMVERLKRGELLARGLDVNGPVNQGVLEIPPARWSILEIYSEPEEVVGPNGVLLVDVMIRMADPDNGRGDAISKDRQEAGQKSLRASGNRPGRPRGSGSYELADAPLIEEMRNAILNEPGLSPTAAALRFAVRAKGGGGSESRAKRLAERYSEKYSS
jgi:hypothetical protein